MPAALRDFDLLLRLVWLGTLALAAVALSVVLVLVLRRLLDELARPRREAAEAEARRLLIGACRDAAASMETALRGLPPEFLLTLLDELTQVVRGEARRRLADVARRLGLVDRLLRDARSWRPGVRAEAARRLALHLDSGEVRGVLLGLLGDRAGAVRLAAAEGLVEAADLRPAVIARALTDSAFTHPAARRFWQRLAQLDAERFTDLFRRIVDAPRRLLLIEAAAAAGLVGLGPEIARASVEEAPELRRVAAEALLELGHPLAAAALERLANDSDAALRAAAAILIGRRQLARFRWNLQRLLEDPDPLVRFRAREAWLRIGEAAPALEGQGR